MRGVSDSISRIAGFVGWGSMATSRIVDVFLEDCHGTASARAISCAKLGNFGTPIMWRKPQP